MRNRHLRTVIVSLGCSKNLIDSERLAARLRKGGLDVSFDIADADGADAVVVNTCGFIGDAKEESVNTVLDMVALKQDGHIGSVFLMGCLGERYRAEITDEIPELDGVFGKFDWEGLTERITAKPSAAKPWERELSTAPHYTYVKISEGCDRFCAFCAIPLITGRHRSRPADEILAEVADLAAKGTREFNVIAQDLSSYGKDLGAGDDDRRSPLARLIDRMADIPGVDRIRLHYAYPADFPLDVLDVMRERPNVCRYLDIALQHIDNGVLTNMRRHIDADATRALLAEIRRRVPGIHIRTTMMTGFPGEDDAAFGRLLDFVSEQRFERLGAFAYCEEEGTFGERNFSDDIPEEVKKERLDRLMALQQDIAFEIAESKAGSVLDVIIDEESDEYYIGRTEFDSPEVDTVVMVDKKHILQIGNIYPVRITSACGFDLMGTIASL